MSLLQIPVAEQDIDSLLTEPYRIKEYARQLVERYVADTRNAFDGTLHPGLNAANPAVRFDIEKYKFTEDVSKTGDDNEDL
jgi:hypothetical protein